MKTFDDMISHLNPFEQMDSDTGGINAEHVDQFIKDKKVNEEHKRKENEMIKTWKEEIKINKGENNE